MPPFDGHRALHQRNIKFWCPTNGGVDASHFTRCPFLDAVRNASHRQEGEVERGTRLFRYRTANNGAFRRDRQPLLISGRGQHQERGTSSVAPVAPFTQSARDSIIFGHYKVKRSS